MRSASILLVVLVVAAIFGGCVQTPATVEKEVPGVLDNVSRDVLATPGPTPTLDRMLRPIETSPDYVAPPAVAVQTATVGDPVDPIVGDWQYSGSAYQCNAEFLQNYVATAHCSAGPVTIAQRAFVWTPESSQYSWMRNYTVMDLSDKSNYTVEYSENTGELTSSIVPDDGYFVKVN